MVFKGATARTVVAVVATLGSSSIVKAAPTGESNNNVILEKRKPILSDSDQLTINHKVPADVILLVGAGLVAALFCLCLALWNIYAPNTSGSRRIREERAQAKTELRLKGAGGSNNSSRGTSSPTRNMMEKKRGHNSHATTVTDFLSVDSHTKLVPTSAANTSVRFGPRVAPNAGRSSRASRGYSSYSKHDVQSLSKINRIDSVTMLAVPRLSSNNNNADSSSSSRSISSGSANGGTSGAPWHARPSGLQDRSQSYNSPQHNRRISDSIGRGIDLNRNRSLKNYSNRIHVTPQLVDPTYSNQQRRVSPQGSTSDLQDPLSGYELKRFTTDPGENRENMPRNNTSMNALDFFGYNSGGSPIYANRHYITDNGSDNASHETLESPSTPLGLPRTKQMVFYDADEALYSPKGTSRQESYPLNHYNSHYTSPASPTRQNRKVWGSKF